MVAFSWIHLAVLIAAAAVVAFVVVLTVRRWRRSMVDRTIGFTLTLSAFFAAMSVLGAIFTVVNTLTTSQVGITMPVRQFWPELPPGTEIEGATASVAFGGFERAEVGVEGLDLPTRILWASGLALGILVPAAIAALIALACFQLLRGAAFAPVVARAALITAVVVLVGGIGAAVLSDVAGTLAAQQVLDVHSAMIPNLPDGVDDPLANWPKAGLNVTIPLWPIGAGLGFAALAAVLRYGSRLQRDTEGLV